MQKTITRQGTSRRLPQAVALSAMALASASVAGAFNQNFEVSITDPNDLSPTGATYFTSPVSSGLSIIDGSGTIGSGNALNFQSPASALTGIEWNFVDSAAANMKQGKLSFDFYLPDASFGTNHQLEFGMRAFVDSSDAALREVGEKVVRLRFDQKETASLGGHRIRTGNVSDVAFVFQPQVSYHLEMFFNAHHDQSIEYTSPGGTTEMLAALTIALYIDGSFAEAAPFRSADPALANDDPNFGLGRLGFWSHNSDPARSMHFQIDNLAVIPEPAYVGLFIGLTALSLVVIRRRLKRA